MSDEMEQTSEPVLEEVSVQVETVVEAPDPDPPQSETETAYRLGMSEAAEAELRSRLEEMQAQIASLGASVDGLRAAEAATEEQVEELTEEVMPEDEAAPEAPSRLSWWERMLCGGGR